MSARPGDLVPRLETERTVMREWRDDDLDAFAAAFADPEVMRYLGREVFDREQTWRMMSVFAGHWQLRGYGTWVVERRDDGAVLGRCGLWYPEGWPGVEVGWTFAREAWGHGYATEAARASISWAWSELALPRLISLIDPSNAPSIRVAERLGMSPRRQHEIHGTPVVVWGLQRPIGHA